MIQTGCVIRGDLANVSVGKFGYFGARVVLRPPGKQFPARCMEREIEGERDVSLLTALTPGLVGSRRLRFCR